MSANHRLETLFDLTSRELNLHARCACGHRGTIDGKRLLRWAVCHRWDTRIGAIAKHLRCSRCGGRPSRIQPSSALPLGPRWGPQDDGEWKRLIAQLRNS